MEPRRRGGGDGPAARRRGRAASRRSAPRSTPAGGPAARRSGSPIAAELIELAEARGAPVEAAEAHLWRRGALLELCRLDEADAHLARYAEIAEQAQQFQLLVHRDALRAMRALLRGDYERGERRRRRSGPGRSSAAAARRRSDAVLLQCHAMMLPLLNERGELGPDGRACSSGWCR